MGEEKQFGAVNGKPDSDGSNNTKIHGWSKSDFTSNGNLKREYFKSHSYAPHTTLDSDGTLGSSGNESDSSEELHYGPGFVSRLKSRYMSVALRGSTGLYGKTGSGSRKRSNLRRTASLEDFLDQEKNDEQIEIQEAISAPSKPTFAKNKTASTGTAAAAGRVRPKVTAVAAVESRASRSKERTRQDTIIKRCQSVEVLSVTDRIMSRKSAAASSSTTESKPPPLPPKSERPLETILNTTLANDNIVVEGSGVEIEINAAADKKVVTFRNSPPEVSPTSMASLKKPFHKRRSSGLLFGVEERELPAPDIVKDRRKIFETIDKTSTGRGGVGGRGSFLTKSQSTSSLYSSTYSNSRSPSRERSNNDVNGKLARKKSDENIAAASRRHVSPQRRVTYVNYINKSSLYRNVAPKVNSKPSLPTKPTNIHFSRRDSIEQENVPVLPAKKNSVTSPPINNDKNVQFTPKSVSTSTTTKTPAVRKPSVVSEENLEEGMKVISKDSLKNIRQSGATYSFSFQSDSVKNQKTHLPNLASIPPSSKQVGVIKPITRDSDLPADAVTNVLRPLKEHNNDSIKKAQREDENNTETEVIILRKEERQTELPPIFNLRTTPVKKTSSESVKKEIKNNHINDVTANSSRIPPPVAPWVTVGAVLKTENKAELIFDDVPPKFPSEPPPPVPASRGVRFSNGTSGVGQILTATPAIINTSDSSEDTEDSSFEQSRSSDPPVKVAPPVVAPPPRLSTQEKMTSTVHQFLPPAIPPPRSSLPEKPVNSFASQPEKPNTNKIPAVDEKPVLPSPPRSPPINHSSGDNNSTLNGPTLKQQQPAPVKKKAAEPVSNSMVFNFVNSDKHVPTHIENDGLDISKRRSKNLKESGVVILAGNIGESCDDGDSDVEEVDATRPVSPCRVTFVGANVVHGKSSLRSKTKTKKMKIAFKDHPEIFEYPSYEATATIPLPNNNGNATTVLKSTNNAIGSFGGLGSYTPSKIQGLDNAFQLGVTRTPSRSPGSQNNDPSESTTGKPELDNSQTSNGDLIITSSESLWPAKDAVSWSGTSSASSDMLF